MRAFLESILCEDLGRGDLFSQIFSMQDSHNATKNVAAKVIAKESGIFSGVMYAKELCNTQQLEITIHTQDSQSFQKGDVLLEINGAYTQILKIERTLLNLLQHSSGIATLTNRYVKAMQDSRTMLLDTRKTRPLLRELEKYSVRNGGAKNHRLGLDTLLMLKDTHLAHISDLKAFVALARKHLPFGTNIEVECQNLISFKEALDAQVDIIMCDNMPLDEIKKALHLRNQSTTKPLIELSGNITLANIHEYANLGADAISCGSIIHQAQWIDMSMKMC